ncbi:MAG: sensor histidine kinase [Ruthenibacterium sp.]
MNLHSTKFKIIVMTIVCVLFAGVVSNSILYTYLNGMLLEKAERIDTLNLSAVQNQLEQRLTDVFNLAILCANDTSVTAATQYEDLSSLPAKQTSVRAQVKMMTYLRSSSQERYVNKLLAFNAHGLTVQSQIGTLEDYARIHASPLFEEFAQQPLSVPLMMEFAPSIMFVNTAPTSLHVLANVQGLGAKAKQAYVFLELDRTLFTDVLDPFTGVNNILIASADGKTLLQATDTTLPFEVDLSALHSGDTVKQNGQTYQVKRAALSDTGLVLYSYVNLTALSHADGKAGYTFAVVGITCLLVALALAVILSNYITRPINRLIARIKRISANDFSYDPTIEQSQDEIGQIGKVVNEMTMSIDHLISETESMYEQRKNIEISLLQSQVNPHFLYNTLDSVHWMAVIQKNPGIANMTRSLVNLLKNIAKGTQDKITLREEIDLLNDYIAIQSIRYLETFEFCSTIPEELLQYRIIKLTLQPLVENAIFHGIEPTGKFGTITLAGSEDGEDLVLTVTDTGAGMTEKELENLFIDTDTKNKSSLNGIGVSNVHTRLKLVYGKQYGLSVESELGKFTRISVRIPKEV